MKKFNLKSAIAFGIGLSIMFIIQNLWTSEPYTTELVLRAIFDGIIPGIISGFLFGLLTGWFASSKSVTSATKIDLHAGEDIVFQTGANHFKGMEGVGGRLYLTNKRLAFKSHKLNVQIHELSIPLTDVLQVERYKSLGLINNGLAVTTHVRTEKFVVETPEVWLEKLT